MSAPADSLTWDDVKLVKEALAQTQKARAYEKEQGQSKYNYTYGDCQGEEAAPRCKPSSPFDEIEKATAQVGDLVARINRLAGSLCGDFPTNGDNAGKPSRAGLLGQVADRSDNLMAAVQLGHEALSRIEQQLP